MAVGEPLIEPERIIGDAQRTDFPFDMPRRELPENGRVQVQVQMPIHVVELETRGVKLGELRADLARELGQEVFLKLHRFKAAIKVPVGSIEAISGWVFTIARNTATDWFRGARLEREATRAISPDEDFEAPQGISRLESRERRAHFKSWLRQLSSSQRRVVWMRLVRGWSYEEISSRIGVSVSAAKCLFYRATRATIEFAPV